MRKTYLFTILSAAILFLCSCENRYTPTFSDFPTVKVPEFVKEIGLDSTYLSYPKMMVSGNVCCIADLDGSDFFFHLYSMPDFKYIKSVGRKGNGDGEIPTLTGFDFKGNIITALSGANRSIQIYDITSESSTSTAVTRYDRTADLLSLCAGKESSFFAYSMTGEYKIVKLNDKGEITDRFFHLEDMGKKSHNMSPNEIWQGITRYNEEKNLVAMATICGDVIQMKEADSSTDAPTLIIGQCGEPTISVHTTNESISCSLRYHGYTDLCLKKYVYALFRGEDHEAQSDTPFEHSVRVFDYEGKPVMRLDLSKDVTFTSMYVDEGNGYLYLINPDSEKPIWVYKM